jgi:hypothetical protein
MLEFSQVIAVYNAIANGVKALADYRSKNSEKYKSALLLVYTAANESKSYITGLKNRKSPDQEREAKIARLWTEAAVNLRTIDRDLAEKCLVFGDSVAESTEWSREQVDEARKSVTAIFEQARGLL